MNGLDFGTIILPFKEGSKISMVLNNNVFNWDTIVGDYSFPFEFEPSPEACIALGFIQLPDSATSFSKKYPVTLIVDGIKKEKGEYVLRTAGPLGFIGNFSAGMTALAAIKNMKLSALRYLENGTSTDVRQYIVCALNIGYTIGNVGFKLNGIDCIVTNTNSFADVVDAVALLNGLAYPNFPGKSIIATITGGIVRIEADWDGANPSLSVQLIGRWTVIDSSLGRINSQDNWATFVRTKFNVGYPDANFAVFPVKNDGVQARIALPKNADPNIYKQHIEARLTRHNTAWDSTGFPIIGFKLNGTDFIVQDTLSYIDVDRLALSNSTVTYPGHVGYGVTCTRIALNKIRLEASWIGEVPILDVSFIGKWTITDNSLAVPATQLEVVSQIINLMKPDTTLIYDRLTGGNKYPYVSLFPYVRHVIDAICKEVYATASGVFLEDEGIKRLVLYNNFTIDKYYFTGSLYAFGYNDFYDLANCMPDMTVGDFLINLRKSFNLSLSFFRNNLIITANSDILAATDFIDLTPYLAAPLDLEKSVYTGFKFYWNYNSNDGVIDDSIKSLEGKIIIDPVATAADLPANPEVLICFCLVLDQNKYYTVAVDNPNALPVPVIWIPYCDNFSPLIVGDGSVEIIPDADIPYSIVEYVGAMKMPHVRHEINAEFFGLNTSRFPLRFLFYHGYTELNTEAYGTQHYPMASADNKNHYGENILPWQLKWDGDDGMYKKWWETTVNFLFNSKKAFGYFNVNDAVMTRLTNYRDLHGFYPKIKVLNQFYIIEIIELDYPIVSPAKFTFKKSTWNNEE